MKNNENFQKLYKFRSWSNPKHQTKFEKRVLDFPSPNRFNDPFDCDIPWAYDKMSKAERVGYLWALGREAEPTEDEAMTAASVQLMEIQMACEDREEYQLCMEEFTKRIKEKYGVLSFAGVVDNMLLWSHYADNHRGFCLEFDRLLLKEMFDELLKSDGHSIRGFPVQCVDNYPELRPDRDKWHDRFTHKSTCWSYEREYRFIYIDGANSSQCFPQDALTAIYLGCQMEDDAMQEITRIAQQVYPDAVLYRAKKIFRRFELEFEPL
jgi:hypothetical protein